MKAATSIKTEVSRDRISQEFSSEINGVHERLYTQAIELADQGVRQALIELGWTPPAAQPAFDLQAELEATNRQVEILSDALAESRREVAQLKAQAAPVQEPVAGKGKELSEQLKLCARNVAFAASGWVDMSSAAMQEMFALIDHVCVGLDSPPAQPAPAQEGRDWSLLEATQESLREHMAEIKRLKEAQAAPVQEPVATKLETQQFNCFHVSAEDFQRLKALPVGARLYTTPPAAQRRIEELEAELMRMQGRELKLQMALNKPVKPPAASGTPKVQHLPADDTEGGAA